MADINHATKRRMRLPGRHFDKILIEDGPRVSVLCSPVLSVHTTSPVMSSAETNSPLFTFSKLSRRTARYFEASDPSIFMEGFPLAKKPVFHNSLQHDTDYSTDRDGD